MARNDTYPDQNVVYPDQNVVYADQTPASQPYQDAQAPYASGSSYGNQYGNSQPYQDAQAPYASSSSQAPQQGGTYGAGTPDTTYYSFSSSSDGEDLAPNDRERERQWLAAQRDKVEGLREAAKNASGRAKKAAAKKYDDHKKTPEYREYRRRRDAFNASAPSRSAPVSDIGPSDSRSSHSSPHGRHTGGSQGLGWQESTSQPTEIEALREKYGYPPPETTVQQSMQAIIMYTNEWAAKGIEATRLPRSYTDFLADNWAKVPKAFIDGFTTATTMADAAKSQENPRLATAVHYAAHFAQAYQSAAVIGAFMESTAQGRFKLDLLRNSAQGAGVALDYTTMYSQQPLVGVLSAGVKGFVQPGAEAVTQITDQLHETHLEQRNARRGAVGGDAADSNRFASQSNLESQRRGRIPRGDSQATAPEITRPPRAKSPTVR
ncbi:hypothetical protein ACIG87_27310 [Micromonospora sp. NPDC051925]|uniref:hypothetical protein n=1 Tax=Micromonospora sp. NPDC051925 TaxID=3364288 RepID=UPI0037C9397C